MKTYIFDGIYGEVARKSTNSMDEAIAWFKRTYPQKSFACVYEQ